VRLGIAPPEYRSVVERGVQLVARVDVFDELRGLLFAHPGRHDTLYGWAERAPGRRMFMGRGPVYAATLPESGVRAIVRHNRHGGLFARVTRDRFLPPTGAPAELAISRRLIISSVPTAEVVAFAVYRSGPLRRADVMTLEITDCRDLGVVITSASDAEREHAWRATAQLLATLSRAGARHRDLNVKNILIPNAMTGPNALEAAVLDVDRIEFGTANDPVIADRNFERLARSARKWRQLRGATVEEDELRVLRERAGQLIHAAVSVP
jgi:3-deoxy-D-manno-octulosonic acid kinase